MPGTVMLRNVGYYSTSTWFREKQQGRGNASLLLEFFYFDYY